MPRLLISSSLTRRHSHHRRRIVMVISLLVMIFLLLSLRSVASRVVDRSAVGSAPAATGADGFTVWDLLGKETPKAILTRGLTMMALANEHQDGQKQGMGDIWQSAVYTLTRVDVKNPRLLLASQMAFLDTSQAATPVSTAVPGVVEDEGGSDAGTGQMIEVPPVDEESPPMPTVPLPETVAGSPLVGIYNTHNAETYLPTDKKDKLEGQNAGVAKVAARLQETLESRYGIRTARAEAIHDYPDWAKSYANSERTVRELLSKNPGLQVLLDIHRDAGLSERQVVKINGANVARVLLIVGSNTRLQHPYWKQNLEFARLVAAKMESLYPGLSKGVRVQDGRYNQHMHPRAILVEVGSSKNSLEEAQRAAELLAQVISEVLKDLASKTGA